jgi:hypothetical protein
MNRLFLLTLVLALLIAPSGIASAAKPVTGTFKITGDSASIDYSFSMRPNLKVSYNLKATGTADGDLSGPFVYEEWGMVAPVQNCLAQPPASPCTGKNHGRFTIATVQYGAVVVEFEGQVNDDLVTGHFTARGEQGVNGKSFLPGHGEYTGSGSSFEVVFTGEFH